MREDELGIEQALERDREYLRKWRSTPEGEADYRATVERMKAAAERLRLDTDESGPPL